MSAEKDPFGRFRDTYGRDQAEAWLVIEREAIGANVGANGYTTLRQANLVADSLGLSATSLLLDVGTGGAGRACISPAAGGARRRTDREMLGSAGFRLVDEVHLTGEFLRTARAWFEGRRRYESEMRAAVGDARYDEQQSESKEQIGAIEDGLRRRALFVCE